MAYQAYCHTGLLWPDVGNLKNLLLAGMPVACLELSLASRLECKKKKAVTFRSCQACALYIDLPIIIYEELNILTQ